MGESGGADPTYGWPDPDFIYTGGQGCENARDPHDPGQDFVLTTMHFVFKMMNHVFKLMNSVFEMMNFVLKMMNFALNFRRQRDQPARAALPRSERGAIFHGCSTAFRLFFNCFSTAFQPLFNCFWVYFDAQTEYISEFSIWSIAGVSFP